MQSSVNEIIKWLHIGDIKKTRFAILLYQIELIEFEYFLGVLIQTKHAGTYITTSI